MTYTYFFRERLVSINHWSNGCERSKWQIHGRRRDLSPLFDHFSPLLFLIGSSCPLGTFRCLGNDSVSGVCLPRRLLCDNRPDCPDGSDEDDYKCRKLLYLFSFVFSCFSPLFLFWYNHRSAETVRRDRLSAGLYCVPFRPELGAINRLPAAVPIILSFASLELFVFAMAVHASLMCFCFFLFFLVCIVWLIIGDNHGELQSFVNFQSEQNHTTPEWTTALPVTVSPMFMNCCQFSFCEWIKLNCNYLIFFSQ